MTISLDICEVKRGKRYEKMSGMMHLGNKMQQDAAIFDSRVFCVNKNMNSTSELER